MYRINIVPEVSLTSQGKLRRFQLNSKPVFTISVGYCGFKITTKNARNAWVFWTLRANMLFSACGRATAGGLVADCGCALFQGLDPQFVEQCLGLGVVAAEIAVENGLVIG